MLILTTHVDDLKGGGNPDAVKELFEALEKSFDKGKCEWDSFEHCGMKYEQQKDCRKIETDMSHYVQQLRPIMSTELSVKQGFGSDLNASAALTALFTSLLGGLAWVTQLRADVSVYVVALQRRMKQPKIIHCKRCNRILSYIKRHPVKMCFIQLTGSPIRVVGISDRAYKIEDDETR